MGRLMKARYWDNFTVNNAMRFKIVARKPNLWIRVTFQAFTLVIKRRLLSKIEESLAVYPRIQITQAKSTEYKSIRIICRICPITTTALRMASVTKSLSKKMMSQGWTKNIWAPIKLKRVIIFQQDRTGHLDSYHSLNPRSRVGRVLKGVGKAWSRLS